MVTFIQLIVMNSCQTHCDFKRRLKVFYCRDFIFESCTWSLEWIFALRYSVLAAQAKLVINCDRIIWHHFSPSVSHFSSFLMWAKLCDKINSANFRLQSSTCAEPKNNIFPNMTADRVLCWKSEESGEKKQGRNDFAGWLVCREKHWRLISERQGSTWKCALEDESVCCLTWEAAVWQTRDSLGEMLPSAAASHCESDGVQTQCDSFICRKHEMLQSHQERLRPQLSSSFPLFIWGQQSGSVVSINPAFITQIILFLPKCSTYKVRGESASILDVRRKCYKFCNPRFSHRIPTFECTVKCWGVLTLIAKQCHYVK